MLNSFIFSSSLLDITHNEHTLTIVVKVASFCEQYETKSYYTCSHCSDIFAFDNGKYTLTSKSSLTIEKAKHTYNNKCDETCNYCGEIRADIKHIDNNSNDKCDNCNKVIDIDKKTKIILVVSSLTLSVLILIFLLVFRRKK